MKIYISIPISGCDIERQRGTASKIADVIKRMGHEPVNPFDTPPPPEHLNSDGKYAYYMGEDIKRLLMCDAIFMFLGWESSVGCTIEHSIANIKKMLVFYSLVQIRLHK